MEQENQTVEDGGTGTYDKAQEQYQDALKNMKAETERKIGNLIQNQEKLQNLVVQVLESQSAPSKGGGSTEADEDLEDLMYSNPQAAIAKITEKVKKEVSGEVTNSMQQEKRKQQIIDELFVLFPELGNEDHELRKKTLEVFSSLPEAERDSPIAYKTAAYDAAAKLGILPTTARQKDEGFNLSSGGVGNQGRSERQKRDKLDNKTLAFAHHMGYDINDPKIIERLKKASKRKFGTWG